MQNNTVSISPPARAGRVRIIGGRWRGRVLRFGAHGGVRPTPDRVRETLFNWLQSELEGRICLDLCAGSGALALEALSRGARHVVAVDNERRAVRALEQSRSLLDAAALELVCADACAFLDNDSRCFDLVFLDPPYRDGALRDALLTRLRARRRHDSGMLVYLELPGDAAPPAAVAAGDWCAHRERVHGGVRFGLYRPAPVLAAACSGVSA